MISPRIVVGFLAAVLFPSTSFSQEVTGTFVVKGASTPLSYAYAFWKDQAPFKEGVMNLYVLLSDVPVADSALPRNDRAIEKMAEPVRDNKIHAFELHFADLGKTLDMAENGAAYHNGIAPARHGFNGFFYYQMLRLDGASLEGKVWMDPESATRAGWRLDATFRVKVPPKP
jgi:hypothetical protein